MRSAALALLLLAALLSVGCGTASTVGLRDEGPAAAGDRAAISPGAATGEEAVPVVPITPAPGSAFVYLLRFDQPQPTRRSISSELTIPEGSLRALLTGPTRAERVLRYSTAIPTGTRLLGFTTVNRTAIVDLSAMPASPDGAESEALLALYQVVYTVTASGTIDAVQVRVAGRPYGLGALSGGSSAQEAPLTRADLSFVVDAATLAGSAGCAVADAGAAPFTGAPSVTITRPLPDEQVTGTIQLRGVVEGKGGALVIRLVQDGIEVASRVIDERCRGRFAATLPVPRALSGSVELEVIAPGVGGSPSASALQTIDIAG